MEKESPHSDSLLYASLIIILLIISYWFTTKCFKILSGIEALTLAVHTIFYIGEPWILAKAGTEKAIAENVHSSSSKQQPDQGTTKEKASPHEY